MISDGQSDLAQPVLRVECDARVDQPCMRCVTAVEFLPPAGRPEQALLVRVVVLGVEGEQGDRLLERQEAEVTVDPAEHFELVTQEVVDLAPGAHVEHAAGEVRTADRDFLADAGAHADETHQVHVAQAQVIEQADRVVGVQFHGRGHAEVVARIPGCRGSRTGSPGSGR